MIPMVKRIIKKVIKALLPAGVLALIRKYYLEKRREKLRKKLLEKKLTKRKILDFEVHLADHCNLNCKGCFHFCPIADEKYPSVQSLENDFKRIYELANGKIGRIYLLGGEPLLHPELIKIINVAGKYF